MTVLFHELIDKRASYAGNVDLEELFVHYGQMKFAKCDRIVCLSASSFIPFQEQLI
ncbi:MAG: hypothetical protein ACI8W8_000516 [Rhodothermales bacterium]|jgi:hypothetical protein